VAAPPDHRRSRLRGLDGLRGLAALGVAVLHVWMYTGARDPSAPALLDRAIGELRLGVVAFFVLSAYLLAGPWARACRTGGAAPRLARFALRRAARVLPGYWFAVAGAFVLLRAAGSGRAASVSELPLFAVLGQNHVAGSRGHLIPPAWSLAVEVSFYVLLPVVGLLAQRLARRGLPGPVLAGVAMIAAGLAWDLAAAVGHWPPTVTTSLPTFLPVFGCGVLAAGRAPGRAGVRHALLAVGAALVAADGWWHSGGTGLAGHVLLDLPAAAGFALVVCGLAGGPARLLELAPVRRLGVLSYGLYLWHLPVLFALRETGQLPAGAPAALAVVLAPALALAAISWHAVERPALRWSAAVGGRRRPPVPAPVYSAFSPQNAA
jgi:peptidoglycan/LPS O-acetylase OafA/YrhL